MLDDLASLDSSVLDDPRLSDSEVLQTVLRMLRGSYGESAWSLGLERLLTVLTLPVYQSRLGTLFQQRYSSSPCIPRHRRRSTPSWTRWLPSAETW